MVYKFKKDAGGKVVPAKDEDATFSAELYDDGEINPETMKEIKREPTSTSIMFSGPGKRKLAAPRDIKMPSGLPEAGEVLTEEASVKRKLQADTQKALVDGAEKPSQIASRLRGEYMAAWQKDNPKKKKARRPSDEEVLAWATGNEASGSFRQGAGAVLTGLGELTSRAAAGLGGGIYNLAQVAKGKPALSLDDLMNIPRDAGEMRREENLQRAGLKNVTQEPGLIDQGLYMGKALGKGAYETIRHPISKGVGNIADLGGTLGEGFLVPQESALNVATTLPLYAGPSLLGKAASKVGMARTGKALEWMAGKLNYDAKATQTGAAIIKAQQNLKKVKKAAKSIPKPMRAAVVGEAEAAVDAAKQARSALPLGERAAEKFRAGLQNFATGGAENAIANVAQTGIERGDAAADEAVMAGLMGGAMNAGIGALSHGEVVAPKADPTVAVAPTGRYFVDADKIQPVKATDAGPAPDAPVDETGIASFRRAVGAGASRDPLTGTVTYGPDSKAALRDAIVRGRKDKASKADRDAGRAAEELVNSHAQENPDNWAEETAHSVAMGERYSLGGGTQTFAHTPADALADMAPTKVEAAKPPSPTKQIKIRDAMDQYIKKGEDLESLDPKVLKRRAASNKFLADNDMLPEDAHQSFSRLSDRDTEFGRIADARARKDGVARAEERSATEVASDNAAVSTGEALLKTLRRHSKSAGLLDKAGIKAISEALKADSRVGGGFRDQLVDHFGEDRVRMFEDATLLPSNRHEFQKGALTGEDPLEAIDNRDRAKAESEANDKRTEEEKAAAKAAETAKAQAEKAEKDKLTQEGKDWDATEKKRFADQQRQVLFKDDAEALARMLPVTKIDPKTSKPMLSKTPKKTEAKNAAEGSRLADRMAKHLSESDVLEEIVSAALPSSARATFDNLMGSIRNMDGKNKSGMAAMAEFLKTNAHSLDGKIPAMDVQRPRAFSKKARPSQE